jgi:hypothetical protein
MNSDINIHPYSSFSSICLKINVSILQNKIATVINFPLLKLCYDDGVFISNRSYALFRGKSMPKGQSEENNVEMRKRSERGTVTKGALSCS